MKKSYMTARRAGRAWNIEIVTPMPTGSPLRTAVATSPDRERAVTFGRERAAASGLPFKEPKASA